VKTIDDTSSTADYLSVPVRTLEDWRYRRIGPPFVRAGRAIRYRKVDVDRWLEQQTVATRS
jgi:hypothetical protein